MHERFGSWARNRAEGYRGRLGFWAAGFAVAALSTLGTLGCGSSKDSTGAENDASAAPTGANLLISDQFNNRVIEITRAGSIVWTFGDGSTTAGTTSVVAPNDAERLPNGQTLITGSGAPQGAEPGCSGMAGCQDNRVFLVDSTGKIVWQYGKAGVAGSGANELTTPVFATMLANDNVLITDQGNNRIIEVTQAGTIAWQYGSATGATGTGPNELDNPNSAERLANGNTLIADQVNNRAIEVTPQQTIAWQYPAASAPQNVINYAAFASRLSTGNTIIVDANNGRVIEVTTAGDIAWSYDCTKRTGSVAMPEPTRAVRLSNGDTLISDSNNHQVFEVDAKGDVVFTYGKIGVPGNGPGELNAPYDAKAIGDYTGLTPPPSK